MVADNEIHSPMSRTSSNRTSPEVVVVFVVFVVVVVVVVVVVDLDR